jgi:DNA primase
MRHTIDQIHDIAIDKIIGKFVTLKKAGKDLQGLCPFHQEKTPSFHVSPSKGIYKCFGCGKGGDAITFIQEYQHLSFIDAVKMICMDHNLTFPDLSPDVRKKMQEVDNLVTVNDLAATFFQSNPHPYLSQRATEDTIKHFGLGYAPSTGNALYKFLRESGVKEDAILKSGLVKEGKNGLYDFFRDRVMFPVYNSSGRVIGFSGRSTEGENPKYLNTSESEAYKKGETLLGYYQARSEIKAQKCAILVEGNFDLTTMYEAGYGNVVAPCGTSLTNEQAAMIKRLTEDVIIIYDGDSAGRNATIKSAGILLQAGLGVFIYLLPEGEDPDSFFKGNKVDIYKLKLNFLLWYADELLHDTDYAPDKRYRAVKELAAIIALMEGEKQQVYIDAINKKHKLKQLSQEVGQLKVVEEEDQDFEFPEGVDPEFFRRYRFFPYKNQYYFRSKEQGFIPMCNFIMVPLFHVLSNNYSRRVYEIINIYGYRQVVEFDMQQMVSLSAFKQVVEGRGNFLFWGTEQQMGQIKVFLYEETKTCNEVSNLGWQKEGFWAWANGIIDNGKFEPVDENGLLKYGTNHYYLPAYSKINIEDKTLYSNERKFIYKDSPLTLKEWATLYTTAYGINGHIAIAFYLAALFRDIVFSTLGSFPILNLYGPRGTGKNEVAVSLLAMFGMPQNEYNIHSGTMAGFAEHLQIFRNSIAFIDEYKNNIDYSKVELLKSVYNAVGRTRMNMDKGKKKETTEVNQAVILAGQEMTTADNALFTRVIFLQFHESQFSPEQTAAHDQLKLMRSNGLAHITSQIINHREYFERTYRSTFKEVLYQFEEYLGKRIETRILNNYCSILAAFKVLKERLSFPFNYDKLQDLCAEACLDQIEMIGQSNDITVFFQILESLYDQQKVVDGWHFRVDFVDKIRTKHDDLNFRPKNVLRIQMGSMYELYAEQANRTKQPVLPKTTLMYYLENSEYFMGNELAIRFNRSDFSEQERQVVDKSKVTTAYSFDYDLLSENYKINLIHNLATDVDRRERNEPEFKNDPF